MRSDVWNSRIFAVLIDMRAKPLGRRAGALRQLIIGIVAVLGGEGGSEKKFKGKNENEKREESHDGLPIASL